MDSEAVQALANSKVADSVIKQLWPSMLFLLLMSLISLFGGKWWISSIDSPTSTLVAFWLWFSAMLIITIFATIVFINDSRIQISNR